MLDYGFLSKSFVFKHHLRLLFPLLSLILVTLIPGSSLAAKNKTLSQQLPVRVLSQATVPALDIVLLIDESGSMAKPSSQPPDYDSWDAPDSPEAFNGGELRLSAAKLIIDLAEEQDRVAVVYFSDKILYSQPLSKIRNERGRTALKSQIRSHFDPTLTGTSYRSALEEAYRLLSQSPRDRQRVVIFLTDGDPQEMIEDELRKINAGEYPISVEDYLKWLAPTIDKFSEAGIPIFPLLFGNYQYPEIANSIAVKTGGIMAELSGTNELLKAYAKIYSRLRPDMFIDYIDEGQDDFQLEVERWQEVNRISFVFEKSKNREKSRGRLISKIQFNSRSLLTSSGKGTLKEKYEWQWRVEPHYDLLEIRSRNALDGKWDVTWREDDHRHGLIIARSELSVDLAYPLRSSSVGVGYYASQHPPIIGMSVKRQGHAYPSDDYAPSIFLPNREQLPMRRIGLSSNDTMWFVQADVPQPEKQQEIIVQLGDVHTPVRLRREFIIRGKPLPYLVERDAKIEGAKLVFRFDINLAGKTLTSYNIVGFIGDDQGQVVEREGLCESPMSGLNSQMVIPCKVAIDYVPGHSYITRLILIGESEGIRYSDFLEMRATTQRKCFLNLPAQETELGLLQFGQQTVSFTIPVIDFQDACQTLGVSVTETKGADAYPLDPELLSVLLVNTSNDDLYELKLLGLGNLPPNQYNVQLSFQSEAVPVEPKTIYVSFEIPDAEIKISSNIIDFGEIATIGIANTRTFAITFPAPDVTPPQFERIDVITTPDESLTTEQVEQSLQWSIGFADGTIQQGQKRTYAAIIKLIKPLPPGGYSIPLEVYHEELPVRPFNKIELRFIVPESKIIVPDTIIELGEYYPWPSTLHLDSWPPLRPKPTTIPITIPVTLKNTDADAVRFKISAKPDPQQEQHLRIEEADGEVHQLKHVNGQWMLTMTAVMPSDMKAGEYQEKIAFDITAPPYTTITPQTLKLHIKRLTFWQYIWKQFVKWYSHVRKAVAAFFTPLWLGVAKLVGIILFAVTGFLTLRKFWRWATGTQNRMRGYIRVGDKKYKLDGKVCAYIIYNKDGRSAYIRHDDGDLGQNEVLVAKVEADEEEPSEKLYVRINEASFDYNDESLIATLVFVRSRKPFRGEIYEPNSRYPWGIQESLSIGFLPEGKKERLILSELELTYLLI